MKMRLCQKIWIFVVVQQGYFVPSYEAALEHAKQFSRNISDQFSVGLYFIADKRELGVSPTDKGQLVPAANIQVSFPRRD